MISDSPHCEFDNTPMKEIDFELELVEAGTGSTPPWYEKSSITWWCPDCGDVKTTFPELCKR